MSGADDEGDDLERAYWKYISPRMTDVDVTLPCPRCGSTDVDHSRGYRSEYTCKKCGKKWKRPWGEESITAPPETTPNCGPWTSVRRRTAEWLLGDCLMNS